MADNANWYVVHTYSGYENTVKATIEKNVETRHLEHLIYSVSIPMESVTEITDNGPKTYDRKVFPGYVLVRMDMNDHTWSIVRNTPGVTGFVGVDGNPIPLSRDEYNKIMHRSESGEAPKRTSIDMEVGQAVKVVSGPLADFDGTVTEVNPESGKVRVTVTIFGRETPVELSFDQVTSIN